MRWKTARKAGSSPASSWSMGQPGATATRSPSVLPPPISRRARASSPAQAPLRAMAPRELAEDLGRGRAQILDVRPSMASRKGHIAQAVWSIRPRIAATADRSKTAVLVADDPGIAALAALDVGEAG